MNSSMPSDALGCAIDPGAKLPPSAITTFSGLISSPHKLQRNSAPTFGMARKVSPGSQPTGAHSLPTEIIQMIFQLVFESCVGSEGGICSENTALWLDEDPLSPSLFPYSPACVCLRWFWILQTIPIYWTRQVITVAANAASFNAARTTLKWAGDRPLKVIVTRHHDTSEIHAESERISVCHAMELLRPYITHIWSLSFNVEHSSSIPSLWRESGCARHLKVLTLMSRCDAGCIPHIPKWRGSSYEYEGKLKVPFLQKVTFSGHFFKDPLMAHPRLASWFKHMTCLTICGNGASGGKAISLYKFLSAIDIFPSVRELTLEDIHFDDNAPHPSLPRLRPTVLCLRRITGRTALRGILTRAYVGTRLREDVTIVDCAICGFREPDPDSNVHFSSTNLTITSPDANTPIEDLVSRWNGERLSMISCPGVSRSFLQRLHGETAPMRLSHLRIVDCNNFSAGDVISLVKSRETQAAFGSLMGVPDDDALASLAEVRVQGHGPPISVKRARWLAEHVARFSWDSVAKDGLRYLWDRSTGELMTFPACSSLEQSLSGVKLETTDAAK